MHLSMQKLFYFSVAVLSSIILGWMGSRLLFMDSAAASGLIFFVCGLLLLLGGILLLPKGGIKYHWQAGILVSLIGMYLLARWSGAIAEPWLARILGSASWLAALILLYITWPGRKTGDV